MPTPLNDDESQVSAAALDFDLNYREPEKREAQASAPRQGIPLPPNAAWAQQGPVAVAIRPQEAPAPTAKSTLPATLRSALIFFVMESVVLGPKFAFAFTAMLAMHECGHVLMARRFRQTYGGLYFVPFMAGMVRFRNRGTERNLFQEAMISLAGPVFGGLCGLLFTALFLISHQSLFLLLARMTFGINLIHLFPVGQLDGGQIMAAIRASDAEVATNARQRVARLYYGLCALIVAAFAVLLVLH